MTKLFLKFNRDSIEWKFLLILGLYDYGFHFISVLQNTQARHQQEADNKITFDLVVLPLGSYVYEKHIKHCNH